MVVGERVPRKDSQAKAEGRTLFIDDYNFPNMLHAAVKRSPHPHARIKAIHVPEELLNDPELVIVTSKDVPGKNRVHIVLDDWVLLADENVKHIGEPIAVIAARTKEQAMTATEAIVVDYEPLPAIFDPVVARNERPVTVFGEGNVMAYHKVRKGDWEDPLSGADVVVEGEYVTPYQDHAYLETNGVIACPEPDGSIIIYGSMQCPFYVQTAVAEVLAKPKAEVVVVQVATGGAFGGKEDVPSQLASLCAVAAVHARKPVKLIYSREEDIETTSKRHPGIIRCKLGARKDGKLVGASIEYIINAGAYATLSPVVLWRGNVHAAGPYAIPNVKVDSYAIATNTVPCGAFRGFGSPQVLYAAETQMDKLAAVLKLDPAELRRRNLIKPGDTTITGHEIQESWGAEQTLDAVLERNGWKDKWMLAPTVSEVLEDAWEKPKRRGFGISTICYGVGLGAAGKILARTGAYVQLESDLSVGFAVGTTEMGQGMMTVLSQIVADALGVPYDKVRMQSTDTSRVPDSGPTVASRATTMSGRALLDACHQIIVRLFEVAGELLEVEPKTLELANGEIKVSSNSSKRIALLKVVQEASARRVDLAAHGWYVAPHSSWDAERGQGDCYFTYATATNVAEVEVDVETGTVDVLRITTAHECGRAINPTTLEGQIEGGTVQGIGYGRFERLVLQDGRIETNNLGDYVIPTTEDTPQIDALFIEMHYDGGPYGAKGIGEQPLMGIAPAITNAIYNAVGVRLERIPALPEDVWNALQQKGRKEGT
ncbi:MAG: xanthine dehydrogenase family protein molybdopterin-binding subunit [Candidatus Heimdallarchaeota archaeon]